MVLSGAVCACRKRSQGLGPFRPGPGQLRDGSLSIGLGDRELELGLG